MKEVSPSPDGYERLGSGLSPLVWDRTGLPVVPETESDPGVQYHLASRIEKYMCRDRPEAAVGYHRAVADISEPLNWHARKRGRTAGAIPVALEESRESVPAFIRDRRSSRRFGGTSVSQKELGLLLSMAFLPREPEGDGSKSRSERGRVVASPGGLYPLDPFVLAWNVDGIEKGVYFLDADGGLLRPLQYIDPLDSVSSFQFTVPHEQVERAAGGVALALVAERLQWKYGARSYRFGCMEAGHVMHALSLGASFIGVELCPIGGFCDAALDELLNLDGVSEMSLYLALFGSRLSE